MTTTKATETVWTSNGHTMTAATVILPGVNVRRRCECSCGMTATGFDHVIRSRMAAHKREAEVKRIDWVF